MMLDVFVIWLIDVAVLSKGRGLRKTRKRER